MRNRIKCKKLPNRVVKYGSLVFNIAALIVSIFGFLSGDMIEKIVFVVLFSSYLIIAACIIITFCYISNIKDDSNSNKKIMESVKKINADLTVFNKNMIKKTNFTLTSIYLQNEKYVNFIEIIRKKSGNLDLIPIGDLSAFKEEIEKQNQALIRDLVYLYNDYLESIVNNTKKILEKELEIKNYQLAVTVTLKLIDSVLDGDDNYKNKKIISAFRDSEASANGEREIGEKKYTIDKNMDFITCLREENFIKNNAKKGNRDYTNEHTDFDQYYNCTITVPLYSDYAGKKSYFGYLCCDVLNKEYDNAIVFDIDEANILSSVAYNMSLFFDNINTTWKNMLNEFTDSDFNNHIFRNLTEKKRDQ